MIIFRYLARQVLQTTAAVALILLAVAVVSRFMQYLGEAANGQKAADALFLIMLYRLPEFLLVILPLALLLGIVLCYGRMYAENEMVSLMGAGIGQARLARITLGIATALMALMGFLSLAAAPWGMRHAEAIVQGQGDLTELDLIAAGQFRDFGGGERVTWTESASNAGTGGRELRNVFVAVSGDGAESGAAPVIVFAESARSVIDEATGARFMRMENVAQYDGVPGGAEFSVGHFDALSILLPQPADFEATPRQSTVATLDLIGSTDPVHASELQWRLSLVMLVPVLAVLAVPMSRVQPRQGRYFKLVPAAFLYVVYFALLEFCRDAAADGGARYACWLAHAAFLALGLIAMRRGRMSGGRRA